MIENEKDEGQKKGKKTGQMDRQEESASFARMTSAMMAAQN